MRLGMAILEQTKEGVIEVHRPLFPPPLTHASIQEIKTTTRKKQANAAHKGQSYSYKSKIKALYKMAINCG